MQKIKFKQHYILILLLTGLLCIWSAEAMAQTPEAETQVTDPPDFITELIERTELTTDQVEEMRANGDDWGHILIATLLAERIAADSDVLTFDTALKEVLDARADGMDFGQIANEYDLKLGRILGSEDAPNSNNPPPFISKLVDVTELTQEQVDQMRSGGAGWGNIMIATRLAERIAADSEDELTFDEALTSVLKARAEGKGFGQIAHENELKVGRVVGNGNKASTALSYGPGEAGDALNLNRERIRNQEKKQNIFGRFINMLGFGRKERLEKPSKPEKLERSQRPEKLEKTERPERPEKPEKLEKPERPERPDKPEKPERPERPVKPEKPEKPERGPRR